MSENDDIGITHCDISISPVIVRKMCNGKRETSVSIGKLINLDIVQVTKSPDSYKIKGWCGYLSGSFQSVHDALDFILESLRH